MKNKKKPRIYVELTAFWGNDDADSTIRISSREWQQICDGAEYDTFGSSYYEGKRSSVSWKFNNGRVSIFGNNGQEYIYDAAISILICESHGYPEETDLQIKPMQ